MFFQTRSYLIIRVFVFSEAVDKAFHPRKQGGELRTHPQPRRGPGAPYGQQYPHAGLRRVSGPRGP